MNESPLPPTLHKLTAVSTRTGMSRSALYREIRNRRRASGEIEINPSGRLNVVHIGKSVRVREQDLIAFMDALAIA